jgi:acyl-CoA synthetase (AMP-forming)/AMP-acid ligase II
MNASDGAIPNLGCLIDRSRGKQAEAFVHLTPGAPALVQTVGDVEHRADALAAGLQARGLQPGQVVALLAANHPDYMPAILGILRAGLVACPLNWKLPAGDLQALLSNSGAVLVLCDAPRRGALPAGMAVALFDDAAVSSTAAKAGERFDDWLKHSPYTAYQPGPDDLACLMYTSGSTGAPKGVPITHAGYAWGLRSYESLRSDWCGQRTLVAAPLFHMNAQCSSLLGLYLGAPVVQLQQFDLDTWLQAIERWQIFDITGVPTMMALTVRELEAGRRIDTVSVRHISIGSAPLGDVLLQQLQHWFPQAQVHNGYGTTESGFVAFGAHPQGLQVPAQALGFPMPGVQVRWRNAPPSASNGVLQIRTPMTAAGYHRNPSLDVGRFIDGWYDTGDVMRRDEQGIYWFAERADDMFVCGGENLHPRAIEALLEQHAAVAQAAVVPLDDAIKGALPVAFVVLRPGAQVTSDDIRRHALLHGPAYAHPRQVHIVESLALAGTQKIDRKALRVLAAHLR